MKLMFWDDEDNENSSEFNNQHMKWKLSIPLEVANILSNWLNLNIVESEENDDYFFNRSGLN